MNERESTFEPHKAIYVPFVGEFPSRNHPEVWEYPDEHEPELQTAGSMNMPPWPPTETGFAGMFKSENLSRYKPSRHSPLGTPAIQYRSFRYVDPNGRSDPKRIDTLWGVVCHRRTRDSFARLIHAKRAALGTPVDRRRALTDADREEADRLIRAFCFPLFLIDRAARILEEITHRRSTHGLFLPRYHDRNVQDLLVALCHHRVLVDASERNVIAPRLAIVLDGGKQIVGDPLTSLGISVGMAYSMLLTGLLDPNRQSYIVGLNHLIGADIPYMARPDPYFKFAGSRGRQTFDITIVD